MCTVEHKDLVENLLLEEEVGSELIRRPVSTSAILAETNLMSLFPRDR